MGLPRRLRTRGLAALEYKRFAPTHIIHHRRWAGKRRGYVPRQIPVRVVDDVCYTRSEWAHGSTTDWELVDGVPVFQGQPVGAEIQGIKK
jgi:hypothetical protein